MDRPKEMINREIVSIENDENVRGVTGQGA
jgi:hypothetical protein